MLPQRQTVFALEHPQGWGNCQSAAMASLLDLPLDQVIDTASEEVRAKGFWQSVDDWLADRGLKIENIFEMDDPGYPEPIPSVAGRALAGRSGMRSSARMGSWSSTRIRPMTAF